MNTVATDEMNPRILLVDDDPTLLHALSVMIEVRVVGAIVETANSAACALPMIDAIDYDAIISDIKMPGMNGLELMERVLKIRPTTPTLLLTGHGNHDLAVEALNAGAYAFIQKPIDRDCFLAWLKRAIQLRQLSRTLEQQNERLERMVRARSEELERRNEELKAVIARQTEDARALRKSDDLLMRAQRAANSGIWEVDLGTNRLTWSEAYYDLFALPRTVEPSVEAWLACIHAEDRPRIEAEYRCAIEEERDHNMEFRIVHPDGSVRWMHRKGQVERDARGRALRVSGITFDITEWKRSEDAQARLAAIVDSSEDAIVSQDLQGVVTSWNHGAERLFGYRADEMLGKPISLIIPSDRGSEEAVILTAIAHGESIGTYETVRVRKDGTRLDVSLAVSPVKDAQGRVIGASKIARDISERKRAEEALQAREAQLRLVTDHASVYIAHCDTEGRYKFVNKTYAERLGVRPEECIGRHISDIIGEAAYETFRDYVDAALSGRRIEFEVDVPYEATGRRRMHCAYVPEFGSDGAVRGLVAVLTDVTARRQAEQALRASEERLRRFVEDAPVSMAMFDREMRYLVVSRRWMQEFGTEHQNLIGRNHYDVHPDMPDAWKVMHQRALTGSTEKCDEDVWVRTDGVQHWLRWEVQPWRDHQGAVGGVILFAEDISDRKRTEEALHDSETRFRALADNISQLAWMADATGWLFWYNRRWFDYTGTTLDEMKGWGWQKVHHPDHLDRVVKRWRQAHEAGEPWEDTFPLRGTDGRYRWFLSRAMPIRDADGRVVRWFGTNTDVTEQREAEEEIRRLLRDAQRREQKLRAKQDQLIQAAKLASIGELASGIAHELNNPLNNIGLFIGNVMDELRHGRTETERALQQLGLANQQVHKAAAIINHLRTFARRPKTVHEAVGINAILRAAFSLMDVQLRMQNVAVVMDLDPADPIIHGNPIQLEQVFINLLSNARDAVQDSEEKQIVIRSSGRGDYVEVTVIDSGPGIPDDMQAHIFEPFFTTKDAGQGDRARPFDQPRHYQRTPRHDYRRE